MGARLGRPPHGEGRVLPTQLDGKALRYFAMTVV
jgi:hypothetical protein